jgi:hypothetical protein
MPGGVGGARASLAPTRFRKQRMTPAQLVPRRDVWRSLATPTTPTDMGGEEAEKRHAKRPQAGRPGVQRASKRDQWRLTASYDCCSSDGFTVVRRRRRSFITPRARRTACRAHTTSSRCSCKGASLRECPGLRTSPGDATTAWRRSRGGSRAAGGNAGAAPNLSGHLLRSTPLRIGAVHSTASDRCAVRGSHQRCVAKAGLLWNVAQFHASRRRPNATPSPHAPTPAARRAAWRGSSRMSAPCR